MKKEIFIDGGNLSSFEKAYWSHKWMDEQVVRLSAMKTKYEVSLSIAFSK